MIYCDIPYIGTDAYIGGFNHDKFYEWARSQKELVIISEYTMPEDFICIAQNSKAQMLSGQGKNKIVMEKLYIPEHQKNLYVTRCNNLEQLLLF